jgi:hypothetical protein
MARTKPPAAPSAPDAAPAPNPAPDAAPAPGSPAAAVHAALAANPGAATAVIAVAAGTGRPATRAVLLAMEQDGTATRVKGSRPGIPDTWILAGATQPGAEPEGRQASQSDKSAGCSRDFAGEDETTGTRQDSPAGPGDPALQDGGDAQAGTSAAPGRETEQPRPDGDAPASGSDGDADPGEQDDEAAPDVGGPGEGGVPQAPDGSGVPREEDASPAAADGDAGSTASPSVVKEITERIGQIRDAANAAATVLAGGGNLRAALAGLDEVHEQAVQARRELKAAIRGRKAPASRPGGLRDRVQAHLDAHPVAEFTPHEIHKVLGNSSGAIANALDTLVKLGTAELATEKPRRFRRLPGLAAGVSEADTAGGAADGAVGLAGAA